MRTSRSAKSDAPVTEIDFQPDPEPSPSVAAGNRGDWLTTAFLIYFGIIALVIMAFILVAWNNA
ncbi:MAG: hypothetical protein AB7G88_00395 [Thermomicrobiales bacterium]